jgi:hypothetical protein
VRTTTWLTGLAALLIAPPAAHADWQYTKWGMTPDQVVAASGGKAKLLPAKQRPRIPPLETAASGEFQDGALELRTTFSFNTDGGGLACVFYGLTSHDGDEAFKTGLISRYGQPQRVSGLPAIGLQTLSWKTATDEIEASFSKDDPAYVMHCAKKK